jgi:hypothetical protein
MRTQTGAKMAVTQGDHAAELAQRVTDMYARIPPPLLRKKIEKKIEKKILKRI